MSAARCHFLLALVALLPAPAWALPDETWLIGIGNNEGAAAEVDLLYAERDVEVFAETMRVHGKIPSRRIVLQLGESAETARRTLQAVNAEIRARAGEGLHTGLIVFYSGHADAGALHLGKTELSMDELKTLVQGSPAGVRVLIVDACRSGGVTRVKGMKSAETFQIHLRDSLATEGLAIITSSAAGESSQESDRLRGSFFSHHLVNALRGAADRDRDGRVTLPEAYAYSSAQTIRSSGSTLNLQHPTYAFEVKGRQELVLTVPSALAGRVGTLRLAEPATYLIMQDRADGPLVAEVTTSEANHRLALEAGRYFVQQRRPAEYREYDVTLQRRRELDLTELPYREVRYDRLVRSRGSDARRISNLMLLGGGHGELVAGEGGVNQLVLGYGADFEWASVGLRLRGGSGAGAVRGISALERQHSELGLGLCLQRIVDLPIVSVGFGLVAEAVRHQQRFAPSALPDRISWAFTFQGLFSVEAPVSSGFSLRLEGGPLSAVQHVAVTEEGAEVGTELRTPLTWTAGGGVVWRH